MAETNPEVEGAGKPKTEEKPEEKGKKETPPSPGKDDEEVPSRGQRPWNTPEERKEFFQKKKTEREPEEDDFSDFEDETERKIAQKLYARLDKRTSARFTEQETRRQAERDDFEIATFLGKPENERFRKYEARARKYAKTHPNYPVAGIFRDLAYDDALAEGAERGKKAETKVTQKSVAGSTDRKAPEAGGYKPGMSKKDHQAFREKMHRGETSFTPAEEE